MIKLRQYKYKEEYTYYMLQALKEGRKDAFRKDFLAMHPTDQTEFFLSQDHNRRLSMYAFLSPEEFGDIFSELKPGIQQHIIVELEREYAVRMLNELPSDDAADFFGLLPDQEADFFLTRMDQEEACRELDPGRDEYEGDIGINGNGPDGSSGDHKKIQPAGCSRINPG
ncbi:hypothetical protein GCM10020370_36200 [Paenibacillus hodogayensis]